MKAVILAGGLRSGNEFSGLTLPRALLPLPDQPVIARVIQFLQTFEVGPIAICANGKTPVIAQGLAHMDLGSTPIHYSQDSFPRGPAGCLKDLEDWLGGNTFIAIQGTAFYDFNLNAMIEFHHRSGAALTVGATIISTPTGQQLTPAGVYIVEPAVLKMINTQGFQDIKEQLLPKVLQAKMPVMAYTISGQVQLIHGLEHYLSALGGIIPNYISTNIHHWIFSSQQVRIHASARLAPNVRCIGPVWIDQDVEIGSDAVIIGPALIGPQVRIGSAVVMHRVAILRNSRISDHSQINNQILGPDFVRSAPAARAGRVPNLPHLDVVHTTLKHHPRLRSSATRNTLQGSQ